MYKNPNLSPEVRAADLLSKMTLDEKLMQMNMQWKVNEFYENMIENGGEPSPEFATNGSSFTEPATEDTVNKLQEYYLNKTRLGIPFLQAGESIHGLIHSGCTKFPQCAGIAGSFDRENVRKMAEIIGSESRAFGIRQVYSPCVDVCRDPRWGRIQEAYGEDPYLSGELGAEYVKGVQSFGVCATVKHFIAFGASENGLNLASAHIGEREIREVMLEPFKKCIDAGALGIMPSYTDIDGIPAHANKRWLRDILRDELGFNGITSSDFSAIEMFGTKLQYIAKDKLTAGKRAIEAGVDLESPYPYGYGEEFKQAILDGEIDIKLIDEAVLRMLTVKFKLGLFEDPFTNPELIRKVHSKECIDLAREMDEDSILLLKNDGILPLDEKKVGRVAVIGNNAKRSNLGDYINWEDYCVSFYDGMVNRLGAENVLYAQGCYPVTYTEEMIEEAVETAKQADTVFMVLGDCNEKTNGVPGQDERGKTEYFETTCGEGWDSNDLGLYPSQKRLFQEITALGKPVVLIYYAGRPCALENESQNVNAFMFSWGGGEQSGNAFANLIFGDKTPSAKLSVSFPKNVGSIPCFYNHKISCRGEYYKKYGTPEEPGKDYVLQSPKAWLPFGYGLSYTKLEYSSLKAEKQADGNIKVWVTVENKGDYDIKESVLLFVKALYCEITPFIKRLRKFHKVLIKKGEKKTVEFTLSDEDFSYIGFDYKTSVNHGEHKIFIEDLECSVTV